MPHHTIKLAPNGRMIYTVRYYRNVASFYVENFGCRATQADGAAIEEQLRCRGMHRAEHAGAAELVVLNTCTVTAAADQDARAAVRRISRENPNCQILVTGCYAQRAPEELAGLPGVKWVVGNSHKHQLADIAAEVPSDERYVKSEFQHLADFVPITELKTPPDPSGKTQGWEPKAGRHDPERQSLAPEAAVFVSDIFAHTELLAAPVFDAANERTRPNLKVQDGCDNRCSFCVIPYVRGQSRSLKLAEVIRQVNALVESGYREVVISGINLGRWGRDLQDAQPLNGSRAPRFEDLVRAILSETALEKLRISSVEPMDWTDELIALVADSPRIAKHAHVPMQSGSDAVLRRMHRRYRPWHYREKIKKIRAAMPNAAIGADVMVGFPGETDVDFEQTRRAVEELPFTYLHVFTYSPRPGTPAAVMPNQVPSRVARHRNGILRDLAARKKLEFMRSFVGKSLQAITLDFFDGTYTEALTDNYLKLRLARKLEPNQWIQAEVHDISAAGLVGEVVRH
jgi:threonylcarbamoyladenosine tRNA methylthiotransferase MtaB